MFYLTTYLTYLKHFLKKELVYDVGHIVNDHSDRRKEGNILFNDAINTFYLRLYGVRHMVKDHSDSEKCLKCNNGQQCFFPPKVRGMF